MKVRSRGDSHGLTDSVRGPFDYLYSNADLAAESYPGSGLSSFNSDGFSLQGAGSITNSSGRNYMSWSFQKRAGFMDIVEYEGTGVIQEIKHGLGCKPGMIITKKLDGTGNWWTWHGDVPNANEYYSQALQLNRTDSAGNYQVLPQTKNKQTRYLRLVMARTEPTMRVLNTSPTSLPMALWMTRSSSVAHTLAQAAINQLISDGSRSSCLLRMRLIIHTIGGCTTKSAALCAERQHSRSRDEWR